MHENDGVFGDEINVWQNIASAGGAICNGYNRVYG